MGSLAVHREERPFQKHPITTQMQDPCQVPAGRRFSGYHWLISPHTDAHPLEGSIVEIQQVVGMFLPIDAFLTGTRRRSRGRGTRPPLVPAAGARWHPGVGVGEVRGREPPAPAAGRDRSEGALSRDTWTQRDEGVIVMLVAALDALDTRPPQGATPAVKPTGQPERLFTPAFALLWAASFCVFLSFYLLLPLLPVYAAGLGMGE